MGTKTDKPICGDCRKWRNNSRQCLGGKFAAESDPVCSDGFEPKKVKGGKAAPPEMCGECKNFDPDNDGGYCYFNSVPMNANQAACEHGEQGKCQINKKPSLLSKAKAAKPEQTKHARYVETKLIPLELLDKHPDAEAFGADVEDRVAMSSSVNEIGMLDPISVMQSDDRYLILDGCGRYDTLKASGATTAMCLVLELDGLTPREFAMHRNTMGRKVTTGQRLMCYLSLNESSVLDTATQNSNPTVTGSKGGRGNTASRGDAFSVLDIASRLGISKNDVSAGIDLLKTRAEAANNDGDVLATGEVYSAVMDGRLPIRRWKPALLGKVKTKNVAKSQTNYVNLATRTLVSLGTVFENWQEIAPKDREPILDKIYELLNVAPEDVTTLLVKRYQIPEKKKAK